MKDKIIIVFLLLSNLLFCQNVNDFVITDFNNDGKQDFVVVSTVIDRITLHTANSNGTFSTNLLYQKQTGDTFVGKYFIKVADLNNDGFNDLITDAQMGILVLINNGNNTFNQLNLTDPYISFTKDISLTDYNGDGKIDILYSSYLSNAWNNQIKVYTNQGNNNFLQSTISIYNQSTYNMKPIFVDYDNDGITDVITKSYQNDILFYKINNGSANYTKILNNSSLVDSNFNRIIVTDLDNNNIKDIITYSDGVSNTGSTVYFNVVNGVPSANTTFLDSDYITIFDYNNDGKNDIYINDNNSTRILSKNGNSLQQQFLSQCSIPKLIDGTAESWFTGDKMLFLDIDGDSVKEFCYNNGNSVGYYKYNQCINYNLNLTSLSVNDIGVGENEILVYPNPTTSQIFFKTNTKIKFVEFYDEGGKLLKREDNFLKINISEFPRGLYFVKIYIKNEEITKKIYKK